MCCSTKLPVKRSRVTRERKIESAGNFMVTAVCSASKKDTTAAAVVPKIKREFKISAPRSFFPVMQMTLFSRNYDDDVRVCAHGAIGMPGIFSRTFSRRFKTGCMYDIIVYTARREISAMTRF